jgi:hypothetical protein
MRALLIVVLLATAACAFAEPKGTREKPVDIAAIYFPGYHRDDHYDAWFGEGWNEWKLLREAKPRFPGQTIRRPAWGDFDEADPKMMARQIDLAADHGIDVFVFDWYWYSGVRILYRPLEEGFLKAKNRNRMRFALMWANHDWRNYFPAPYEGEPHLLLPIRHSPADFERVMDYATQKYFRQPNYWRVDGKPFFGIYESGSLINSLGGPGKTREVFERARARAKAAGLSGVHFAAFVWEKSQAEACRAAGFDSLTTYTVSADGHLPENPTEDYAKMAARHESLWKSVDSSGLPYSPIVTTGWDSSPRWAADTPQPPTRNEYPYGPLAVNATPEKFGALCRAARSYVDSAKVRPPAIFVNAWNEWTEGSALLPDDRYGTGFLDALRDNLRPQPAEPPR